MAKHYEMKVIRQVLREKKAGKSIPDLCKEFGCSHQTVQNWQKRYKDYYNRVKVEDKKNNPVKNVKTITDWQKFLISTIPYLLASIILYLLTRAGENPIYFCFLLGAVCEAMSNYLRIKL